MQEIRKHSISLEELLSELTPSELEEVEKEAKYYELMMKIRQRRKVKKLTQQKLAKKAHLPRTMITKIESGKRNVTVETLMNIAKALDSKLEIRFK